MCALWSNLHQVSCFTSDLSCLGWKVGWYLCFVGIWGSFHDTIYMLAG